MLRVGFDHHVDQERDKRIRALFAARDVTHESCANASGVRDQQFPLNGRHANPPKMTLQQFNTQMSLSRGALYWFILHNSLCAKLRKLCTCLREVFAVPEEGRDFGGSASSDGFVLAVSADRASSSNPRRGEEVCSGVDTAEVSDREGIGKSRCFGSTQEKMRMR